MTERMVLCEPPPPFSQVTILGRFVYVLVKTDQIVDVDHADYIGSLAGRDHVGIGSDFDGIGSVPVGLEVGLAVSTL